MMTLILKFAVTFIAIVVMIPLLICYASSTIIERTFFTSPEDLFESGLDKPIPKSVSFISYDIDPFGFDTAYYIHFKISSEDLEHILNDNTYGYKYKKVDSKINTPNLPDIFTDHHTRYDCIVETDDYTCSIYVNETLSEVYFTYTSI